LNQLLTLHRTIFYLLLPVDLKILSEMLKVFIVIFLFMPWLSIGSMNMRGLEKEMEEIRKMNADEPMWLNEMDDEICNLQNQELKFEEEKRNLGSQIFLDQENKYRQSYLNVEQEECESKKRELDQEKLHRQLNVDAEQRECESKKRDLDQEKSRLQQEIQDKQRNVSEDEKVKLDYEKNEIHDYIEKKKDLLLLNKEKARLDNKKNEIHDEIEKKKNEWDVKKAKFDDKKNEIRDRIEKKKDLLNNGQAKINDKKTKICETIDTIKRKKCALLNKRIEKQIKVTKLMKEQFEIFKSKIDIAKKEKLIEQKNKYFDSMKKTNKHRFY